MTLKMSLGPWIQTHETRLPLPGHFSSQPTHSSAPVTGRFLAELASTPTWVGLQVLNGSGQHFCHSLAGDIHLL